MHLVLRMLVVVVVVLLFTGASAVKLNNVDGKYGEIQTVTLQKESDTVFTFPLLKSMNPIRVRAWSDEAIIEHPVLITVKQERRVTSWQIPLLVEGHKDTIQYQKTSRVLCYDSNELNPDYGQEPIIIALSTSSTKSVSASIVAEEFPDFYVKTDEKRDAVFSASEPVYYSYDFEQKRNNDDTETVLIYVTSDDDICLTVSVQTKECPVRDMNTDITYDSRYQTVKNNGGLTISRNSYDEGFYIVFVAKGDNHDCGQSNSLLPMPGEDHNIVRNNQTSRVNFQVRKGLSRNQYIVATMIVLWTNIGAFLFIVIISYIFYWCGRFRDQKQYDDTIEEYMTPMKPEVDSYLDKTDLTVSDFVKRGRDNQKKSLNYFWHILNIAIFYGLPVVQLMVSYQRAVNASGNLDLCYHNFYCSQPLYFTDFNHIYSNIGYAIFGVLFLCITFFRSKKVSNKPWCGVPRLNGLFYAMGLALIFEGVLSACYHVCPTQSNFQFDTSFMYVMGILIIIKLYQNRHPDINASAYTTFGVLGVAVLLAMFGILYNSMVVMIIFVIAYILLCIYISFKVYFFGSIITGGKRLYGLFKESDSWKDTLRPIRIQKFIMLLIACLGNVTIAAVGLALYPNTIDFGTFLLGIVLINAVVYGFYYLIMKLLCGEKPCYETSAYGILCLIFWGVGSYYFFDASTLWTLTAAESREKNTACNLLDFYDSHDLWHLISAPALFFTFMFLLTIDDDVFDKPQTELSIF